MGDRSGARANHSRRGDPYINGGGGQGGSQRTQQKAAGEIQVVETDFIFGGRSHRDSTGQIHAGDSVTLTRASTSL